MENSPQQYPETSPQQYPQSQQYPQPQQLATPPAQYTGYGQYGTADTHVHTFQAGYGTVIPLRPLGIGDTLDATFRLLKFNPVAYFLFPLIVFLIAGVIDAILTLTFGEVPMDVENFDALMISLSAVSAQWFISFIVTLFAGFLVAMVGTRITLASVRGEKVSLAQSWNLLKPRAGITIARLLGFEAIVFAAALIVAVAMGIIIVAIVALFLGGTFLGGTVFTSSSDISPAMGATVSVITIILILIVIVALSLTMAAFYLRFALAPSAIVAEDIGPLRAIARSWNLTKKSFGYLLGTVIVVSLIAGAIVSVLSAIFAIVMILVGTSSPLGILISSIGTSIAVSVTVTPIQCALMNLIYVNMRFKRENFHLDLISQMDSHSDHQA